MVPKHLHALQGQRSGPREGSVRNCRRVVKLQSLQETLHDGWAFLRDVILLQGILHYVKQPQVLFGSSFLTGNKAECFVVTFLTGNKAECFVITVVYVVLLTEVERCVRLVGRRNPRAWTLTRKQTQMLLIMFSSWTIMISVDRSIYKFTWIIFSFSYYHKLCGETKWRDKFYPLDIVCCLSHKKRPECSFLQESTKIGKDDLW